MTYGNCGDCEFWKDALTDDGGDMIGECRINPPVIFLGFPRASWPRTDHYDGCGQNVPLGTTPPPPPKIDECGHEANSGECERCMPF